MAIRGRGAAATAANRKRSRGGGDGAATGRVIWFFFVFNAVAIYIGIFSSTNMDWTSDSLVEPTQRQKSASQPITELANYNEYYTRTSEYHVPELMRSSILNLTLDDRKVIDTRTCHAPIMPGSPSSTRCCIGAVSTGSFQHMKRRPDSRTCPQDSATYDRLQALALHELEASPVTRPKGSLLRCDICRVLQLLSSPSFPHGRLSIVGDSLQTQLFSGLECELHRRGFRLSNITVEKVPNSEPSNRWRYGIKTKSCFAVHLPPWMVTMAGTNSNTNTSATQDGLRSHFCTNSTVEICTHTHYRPIMNMEQHKDVAETSDVMLIDYGLHYPLYKRGRQKLPEYLQSDADEYELSLRALMSMFRNISECHLMYRQTSAQHFDNPNHGGEYFKSVTRGKTKEDTCTPHKQSVVDGTSTSTNSNSNSNSTTTPLEIGGVTVRKRASLLHNAAVAEGFAILDPTGHSFEGLENNHENNTHNLTFVPFWDFSAKLFDQHPHGQDCTHFCYSPHLWYTTWRHVRNALDRLAEQKRNVK